RHPARRGGARQLDRGPADADRAGRRGKLPRATDHVRRGAGILIAILLFVPLDSALADEADPNLEFFYPLVTGRPVIERELELKVAHVKSREGRETTAVGAIELPVLPRWQIELEVPIVFSDPRDGGFAGGAGDLKIENKFLLF